MHNIKCIKRVFAVLLALFICVCAIPAKSVYAAGGTDRTAAQVVSDMTVGWNIGNSLDSYGQSYNFPYTSSNETYWGNPATTKALIDEVAKAGFNTIRIPVSWGQYTTGSDYKIPDFFMNRVKEVVDYCIANDMYVILNTHHDINSDYCFYVPNNANKSRSEKYFKCVWTQIATQFKNYDYHLVFETMNEPRLVGHSEEWWFPRNNPSNDIREAVACINDYNQVALDAIRATGGNNATRCVMVPGYDASIEGCMTDGFKMPTDSASNRLILSVHAYIPYYFALASDTYVTKFDDNLKYDIDSFFNDLSSKFLSKNVPVVVGETSATNRNNTAERVKWADYYWGTASKYSNVAMVLWDNNIYQNNSAGSDGECHMYIDRNSLQWKNPEIISTIMKHVDGTPATINGKEIPSQEQPDPTPVDPEPTPVDPDPQPVDPTPVDPTPVDPQPVDPTPVDPTPVAGELKAEYTINNWGSGYQVLIKVKNEGTSKVDGWTVKVKKSEVKIDSSWCVNIAEEGDTYVITPMSWNSSLESGASVDFGIQGSGVIGTSVNVTVQ
ncbi:cellulase family glycosylhydrolase [Butyrivibrio sp. VCB2006]|uniref:cellulase family glycosylhydrolase n=1 Tax=Butyrivibrio sp. VCB2006 TaxID=1280679 RepID=UPI00040444F9|nr:cellulase family glycosylhydrolase [Butyrivibrio sp. VCB2006]